MGNALLTFIGKLSAGCIDVFSTASADAYINPVFHQVIGKALGCFIVGLGKFCPVNWVVFNHVYQVRWYLAVNFCQRFSIFDRIIESFEKDIFKRDVVLCFFVEIIQLLNQHGNAVDFIDRHYFIALFIISSVQ